MADLTREELERLRLIYGERDHRPAVGEQLHYANGVADLAMKDLADLRAAIAEKGGTEHYPTEDAYLAVCQARDNWQARAETAERERDEARAYLTNLLAVIHRDGGHGTAFVGYEKSTEYAVAEWARLMTRTDAAEDSATAAEARVAKLEKALRHYACDADCNGVECMGELDSYVCGRRAAQALKEDKQP